MTPPLQLGLGMGLARGGFINPVLLDLDFTAGFPSELTHSRASGATYVDESGLVKWADENLVVHSEDPTQTAWVKSNSTVSVDGSEFKVIPNAAYTGNFAIYQQFNTITTYNQEYSFVAEMKADGISVVEFAKGGATSGTGGGTVNLSTGAVTGTCSVLEALADGWYRVQCVITMTGGTLVFQMGPPSEAGDGSKGWLLRKVRVYRGTEERPYVKTTSSRYYAPRITHDPVTLEPLGYLHEPAATNLVANSTIQSDYSTAAFTPVATTLANGVAGVESASDENYYAIYDNTGGSFIVARTPYTRTSSTQRQLIAFTTPAGCTSVRVYPLTRSSGTAYAYISCNVIGNTEYVASFYHQTGKVGGVQLELGSAATSLIPTSGASATRAADKATVTDFSFWTGDPVTLLFNGRLLRSNVSTLRILGSDSPTTWMYTNTPDGTDSVMCYNLTNGTQYLVYLTANLLVDNKMAVAVTPTEIRFAINGTLGTTRSHGGQFLVAGGLEILGYGGTQTGGIVREVQILRSAYSTSALQTLTTP